jgi:riboflavin synthase alpha subunit
MKVTTLREKKVGDFVNLEADLLGKYAEKFLTARGK